MAKHKNQSKWELFYSNFLEYKGTMINYCTKNNINYRTFQNWCSKLRKLNSISTQARSICSNNSNKTEQSKFVQFQLSLNETIKIRLPNGITIEIVSKNLPTIIKELAHAI